MKTARVSAKASARCLGVALVALWVALTGQAQVISTNATRGQGIEAVLGSDVSIPTYHALIVGINDYQNWVDLREARQDAEAVAELLRNDYGFADVRTLYDRDATRQNLISALRGLTGELGPQDALLIYFSGHGYYDKLLRKGYWIPTEAREKAGNDPAVADWFDNTTLRDYIGAMKTRQVLVVCDSCFSGALFRGGSVDLSAKENAWYRRAIASPSRWCITSGDLETVPDASVFARKFLQAMQYPQQAVFSASDLASWIKKEVASSSDRQCVFGPLRDDGGSADGEFVFLKRLAVPGHGGSDVQLPLPGEILANSPLRAKPAARKVGNRCLLVFDTSAEMKSRVPAVQQALNTLLATSMNGQLRLGDTIGVWTFNQELRSGQFPLQRWAPDDATAIASAINTFVGSQQYEEKAHFEAMVPLLNQLVQSSERLTVLIFCDGKGEIHGTPYDAGINQVFTQREHERQKARLPIVIVLRSQRGQYTGCMVSFPPQPVSLPEFPPLPELSSPPSKAGSTPLIIIGASLTNQMSPPHASE